MSGGLLCVLSVCVFFLCGGREGGGVGLVGVFFIFGRVVLLIGLVGVLFWGG